MKHFAALAFALQLAACASAALDDPVFKAGYEAGCGAAHSNREARASMTQGQPDLYRRGFASGLTTCGGNNGAGRGDEAL